MKTTTRPTMTLRTGVRAGSGGGADGSTAQWPRAPRSGSTRSLEGPSSADFDL